MRFIYQLPARKILIALPVRRGTYPRRYASNKSSDPLRILFCGSEDFSIASLRAVHDEHRANPGLISSIDVVCRPPKRVGRNLKTIREGDLPDRIGLYPDTKSLQVPISAVARELSLPLHQIDTFTGWSVSRIKVAWVSSLTEDSRQPIMDKI